MAASLHHNAVMYKEVFIRRRGLQSGAKMSHTSYIYSQACTRYPVNSLTPVNSYLMLDTICKIYQYIYILNPTV